MADAQVNNFISRTRDLASNLIDDYNALLAIRDEFAKRGFTSEIINTERDGLNLEIGGSDIIAVMTSIDNLKVYFDAGNGSNLYAVKP